MAPQFCRVCTEETLYPLWDGWHRCLFCGSDSNSATYDRGIYDAAYLSRPAEDMRANLDWFQDHAGGVNGRDFLDIGCTDGTALRGMAERGFSTHGFDVIPEARTINPPGDHITIGDRFKANLFPMRYSAILARNVIECVPDWRDFMFEVHAATRPTGLVQIQTPRPTARINENYRREHLQIIAPLVLRWWAERVGLDVMDFRVGDYSQTFICRRER